MAELLLRIVDQPGAAARRSMRGDVVEVHPDGHPWTARERTNPAWRIVRVYGFTEADRVKLLARERPSSPEPSRALHLRAFSVDLDALGESADVDAEALRQCIRSKPALTLPETTF